jgi:peptide/nickel transport system substrate-binding protein
MIARIILIILVILTSSCNYEKSKTSIIFGIAQKPQNFDPSMSADAASERINHLLYSYLFQYDDTFRPHSNFVSWKYEGNLRYIFLVEKNLPFFSNMDQMTADDIVGSINFLQNSKTSRYATELSIIKSIKLISAKEFQLTLYEDDPNFLSRLVIPIFPHKLLKKKHNFSIAPIGSGPFILLPEKNKVILKRRADNQNIEFIEIKDPTVRALKLIKNEVDIIQNDLPIATVNFLKAQAHIVTQEKVGANISYLGFNFKNEYLKITEIRQAIEMAIDKKAFIKYFFNEKTRNANQLFPPEHWVHEKIPSSEFNPQKARDIIQKYNGGKPIEIVYKTSTDPFRMKVATIIQNQLADIGINLIIKSLDWGTYFRDIQAGNFDMYSLTWVGIKNPNMYEKIFFSENIPPIGLNRGNYENHLFDSLIENALSSNNWSFAIRFIFDDVAFIPLWFEGNVVSHTDKIRFYDLRIDGNWKALENIEKL